ncbi:hypothetical protein CRENBAI_007493 [Crenichthys baileyi]|uniref:Uncharacterized protein n=1 Tax=Crenichthys baileyi TaxID=28760 RepID=A0AAV9QUN7_9TELE
MKKSLTLCQTDVIVEFYFFPGRGVRQIRNNLPRPGNKPKGYTERRTAGDIVNGCREGVSQSLGDASGGPSWNGIHSSR